MSERIDWDTLPAGPELDAILAERVLGWSLDDCRTTGRPKGLHPFEHYAVMKSSADPYAAWLVVEAMEARGLTLLLDGRETYPDGSGKRLWHASFWRGTNMCGTGNDTAPLAICRAALAALEAEL